MKETLKWIISRTFVFYAILCAVSFALIDYKELNERLMIRTLNHNIPIEGFGYLIRLGEGGAEAPVDRNALEAYARYYEKVVQFFPNLPDAHGMLGFNYFYLDQPGKAL